ncbi:hypothetical protein CPB86DRAFT_820337 [Serendipita vermifera]|nr:hypothetical protein CPB86DRAFT_820337 [Serendipita vermifera]
MVLVVVESGVGVGLEVHCLYSVYGRVWTQSSQARNSPKKKAWICIAYLPVVSFKDPKKIEGTLINRLFHQCMEVILRLLERAGLQGLNVTDSKGDIRSYYPCLAAYLADYPEQILVNAAASFNSPVTTASYTERDDPTATPPRTCEWILHQIMTACEEADPDNIAEYQDAAKKLGLNGVHRTFWSNLPGYQPDICIAPDILHGVLRFWRDTILKWTQALIGDTELDKHLRSLQHVTGYRSYKNGIKGLAQWTGKEDRELMCVLVAVAAGAPEVDEEVMSALHAFHDVAYFSQYHSHSTSTLKYLSGALK